MKKFKLFYFLLIIVLACNNSNNSEEKNPTTFVNPFIGTGGHGHTFPGATVPFGMVQLSPDTRLEGWDGCSGYHFTDSIVYGFSHTHLSGTGVGDYCDILFKPCIGEVFTDNGSKTSPDSGYASYFSKETEQASTGYYSMDLKEGIKVELTSTARAGFHKYTFEENENAHLVLDLTHRDKLLGANIEFVDSQTVRGYRRSQSWAQDQHVYFYAKFSKPVLFSQVYVEEFSIKSNHKERLAAKAVFKFDIEKGEELYLKVGISAVDEKGAQQNLEQEIPDWDFENTRKASKQSWNSELSKIQVDDDNEDDKTIFYTALYHSMIAPNIYSDVDGRYRKMIPKDSVSLKGALWGEIPLNSNSKTNFDKESRIGQLKEGEEHYTVFSLWDTYRATHPLYTIIDEKRTNQYINTFLRQYLDGGQLPVWELAGNYTGCMIGYHSVSVIADAYVKGIRAYDTKLALEAMMHSSNLASLGRESFINKGYIPSTDEPESVSKTLEYAYDDWCIAVMAEQMGRESIATHFFERAQNYKNLYNKEENFIMGRSNGGWVHSFRPDEVNFNYTEANGWQYSLAVPQDIEGFIDLMGGKNKLEAHLDQLFTAESETSGRQQADITGLVGQYAHGNEPSHHMAYLYNYVGKAWKTQSMVNRIMNEMYQNAPDGLSGNEDCGQMSSWYVLSALGFYPVLPGSNEYVIGTPRFKSSTIQLENGKSFTIKAKGLSESANYILAANLNGSEYTKSYITHEDILNGGTLEFIMGAKPNMERANKKADLPNSAITSGTIAIKPTIEASGRTFEDSIEIRMNCSEKDFDIYYTTDGTMPLGSSNHYDGPFYIHESSTIKSIVISQTGSLSKPVQAEFFKIPSGRVITFNSNYSNQYSAGGDKALIDMLRGGSEFRTGGWQGYEGTDLDVLVFLGEVKSINKVILSCLQDIKSWIWFPKKLKFYTSMDGHTFEEVGVVENDFSDSEYGSFLKEFELNLNAKQARYIQVKAENYGTCPEWHLGSGGKAWLFVDEVLIE